MSSSYFLLTYLYLLVLRGEYGNISPRAVSVRVSMKYNELWMNSSMARDDGTLIYNEYEGRSIYICKRSMQVV